MVTAAVVNVAQFPALELDMSDWYEAIRTKPGHELPDLIDEHFDSTQARFELYLQLRDLAPNATVTVPVGSEVIGEHLLGLAAAVEVVRSDAPSTIDAATGAALEPAAVATGFDRDVGDYVIALPADGPVEELVLVQGPDRAWIVEAGLLDEARGGA